MVALALVLQELVLLGARVALFYACRNYFLRNLYHDLQDLSAQQLTSPGTPPSSDDADFELEGLPAPVPASNTLQKAVAKGAAFHTSLSRSLFSLCFMESCMMFLLLMCQTVDWLDPKIRLWNWNASLVLLVLTILVLIPLSYSLVLSGSSSATLYRRPSFVRITTNLLSVGVFLFLLSCIPLPSSMPTSDFQGKVLSRLTVLGTTILGALSGFGAINTAWNFFPRFRSTPRSCPTDNDISAAEEGLKRVRDQLAQRQAEIQKLRAAQAPEEGGSWFSRVVPNFRGDNALSSATQELSGLEALEYQMLRNLENLRQRRADAKFSGTFVGRLFNWGGSLFAIYCVYRILNSIVNLLLPTRMRSSPDNAGGTRSVDMLSAALAHLLSLLPSVEISTQDITMISRQISLALVGAIILSSIRLVLRGVARVLRVTSRNMGASLMLLMLAQLMGIYLLSTLIQLRTSFPPPPARPDTEPDLGTMNLFSTLPEYQLFGNLFDGSFLLAAGLTAGGKWFGDRITGAEAD